MYFRAWPPRFFGLPPIAWLGGQAEGINLPVRFFLFLQPCLTGNLLPRIIGAPHFLRFSGLSRTFRKSRFSRSDNKGWIILTRQAPATRPTWAGKASAGCRVYRIAHRPSFLASCG